MLSGTGPAVKLAELALRVRYIRRVPEYITEKFRVFSADYSDFNMCSFTPNPGAPQVKLK